MPNRQTKSRCLGVRQRKAQNALQIGFAVLGYRLSLGVGYLWAVLGIIWCGAPILQPILLNFCHILCSGICGVFLIFCVFRLL